MENKTQKTKIRICDSDEEKKLYVKPELLSLGDLRGEILGGTLGSGESGAPTIRRRNTPGTGASEETTGEDPYAPEDPNEDPGTP
jgi:hypothetical protein